MNILEKETGPTLPMQGRPTQKDVARRAGISQATVSRYYSKKGYISSEAVTAIEEAAAALNYTLDSVARILVKGESDIYALIIGTLNNPFYPVALEHLTQKIREYGKEVLLFNTAREDKLDELLPVILRYRVAGAVILTAHLQSQLALELEKNNIPAVLFNRYNNVGNVHAVACDNIGAGAKVAEEFLKAGYRNIGYLGGLPGTSTNRDRYEGLARRLKKDGIRPSFRLENNFTHEWGWRSAARILSDHPDTQAVFCGDDAIAMGLLDGIREIRPKETSLPFAVVGVDDIPGAGWPSYSLSTIRQPLTDMTDLALSLLEDRSAERRINFLPGELVRRGSF